MFWKKKDNCWFMASTNGSRCLPVAASKLRVSIFGLSLAKLMMLANAYQECRPEEGGIRHVDVAVGATEFEGMPSSVPRECVADVINRTVKYL